MFLPLELVEKCVGSRIWIITKQNTEFVATLKGFDAFLNLVLEDVTEFEELVDGGWSKKQLDTILLNSKSLAMLVPAGEGPEGSNEEPAAE
eukprot:TRINITY_DN25902_c0_g1_i1.p1 TRINITY_DN25902_c0_g1~~TRINITY_DN25902_c0_g1_i1.p1  ORF type:complete len:105 (+),score=31.46 TRINITY_DN25902_c0_g1_i1:44-316(+)